MSLPTLPEPIIQKSTLVHRGSLFGPLFAADQLQAYGQDCADAERAKHEVFCEVYSQVCREAERDRFAELCDAAQGVIDRWESPLWKDQPHTAEFIARLRAALEDLK